MYAKTARIEEWPTMRSRTRCHFSGLMAFYLEIMNAARLIPYPVQVWMRKQDMLHQLESPNKLQNKRCGVYFLKRNNSPRRSAIWFDCWDYCSSKFVEVRRWNSRFGTSAYTAYERSLPGMIAAPTLFANLALTCVLPDGA